MKKFGFVMLMMIMSGSAVFAYDWVIKSDSYYCWPTGMAIGEDGVIYVTGGFGGYFKAGNKKIEVKSAKPVLMDFYLAAYSADGEFLWAAAGGGEGADCGTKVKVGSDGVYVCGYYEKSAEISGKQVKGSGLYSHFVAKYSFKGKLLWIQTATDSDNMWPNDLALDKDDNVYAVGFFKAGATVGNKKLKKLMDKNIYIVKYNSDGEQQWVSQAAGGTDFLTAIYEKALAVSPDGDVFVCGQMIGEVMFDKFKYKTSITKFSKNEWLYNYEMFIAKYDTDGNFQWMKCAGLEIEPLALELDNSGNFYVCGYFTGILTGKETGQAKVGGLTIQSTLSKEKTPTEEAFVAKLDPDCKGIWAKSFGGQSYDRAYDLTVAPNGDVAFTGNFANEAKFDSKKVKVKSKASLDWDMFICELDKNGKVKDVWSASGEKTDLGAAVYYSSSGELYGLGFYNNTADFSGEELTAPTKYADMYILKVK